MWIKGFKFQCAGSQLKSNKLALCFLVPLSDLKPGSLCALWIIILLALILCFFWWFYCLKWPHLLYTSYIHCFCAHPRKAGICLMEKRRLSHEFCFSMSYSAADHAFDVNELTIVVQLFSHVQLFVTPWIACSMPGLTVLHYLLEFAQDRKSVV